MGSLLFFAPPAPHGARFAVPVHGTACSLVYHISKLTLRVPLVFTKKQGIYAAKLMLRLRPAFVNRTYYTITPRSGLHKTASIAVLHGSMFSKPCAPAQGRVPCTRAAAQAAALGLLYPDAAKTKAPSPGGERGGSVQRTVVTRREMSSFSLGSGSSLIEPKGICATSR